jgi:SAM-dependent methyltransferase
MWSDVIDLRDFYESGLGRVARRMIRRRIRSIWPNLAGQTLLGLGFATPYMRPFRDEAERVVAVMPATRGVLPWPPDGRGLVALADESELPLPDLSVDRVLLAHGLENAEQMRPMLREIWRVMAGNGRLLVVVPNRRGIWARLDRTPFGSGRPYSLPQLSRLLRDTMFTPVQSGAALFVPPGRSRMLLGSAQAWERLGARIFPTVAGVVMIEASKQIYAAPAERVARRRRKPYVVAQPPATKAAERRRY